MGALDHDGRAIASCVQSNALARSASDAVEDRVGGNRDPFVTEKLAQANTFLPAGVVPYLAPDATALGQIFWYTVMASESAVVVHISTLATVRHTF